jgi:RNA polymerase sigma factor (sigma-70 family)
MGLREGVMNYGPYNTICRFFLVAATHYMKSHYWTGKSMHSAEEDIQNIESEGRLLYDSYASTILTFVSRQVAHQQDAEDITLEVFVAALHHQELFALSSERQLAWLRRVARNKIIDHYRRNSHVDFVPLEQNLEFADDNLTPEEFTLQREVYKQLYTSLRQLSTQQQQILQLRYGNGLPFADIAELLHQSPSTVRKSLIRALHALRAAYERHERTPER